MSSHKIESSSARNELELTFPGIEVMGGVRLNSLLNIYFIISYGLVTQIMSLAFQKYPLRSAIFLRSAIPFGLS